MGREKILGRSQRWLDARLFERASNSHLCYMTARLHVKVTAAFRDFTKHVDGIDESIPLVNPIQICRESSGQNAKSLGAGWSDGQFQLRAVLTAQSLEDSSKS